MSSDINFRVQEALKHIEAASALLKGNTQTGAPSSSLKRGNVKPCNKCGKMIYLQQQEGDRWLPYNAQDSTKHSC